MTRPVRTMLAAIVAMALVAPAARAQDPDAAAAELIPLEVQVVVTTYRGDEVVSSLPYLLSVVAGLDGRYGPPAQMRMGSEVPVMSGGFAPTGGGPQQQIFNYRTTGTNIDALASTRDRERFQLNLTIEDNAVRADDEATPASLRPDGQPVFRTFRSANVLVLREGESRQFTAGADRVTGEVVRVDVTLSVLE